MKKFVIRPVNELSGLNEVIKSTLTAHPGWVERESDGVAVCANPECDWVKPPKRTREYRWLNHQTAELMLAIDEWYYEHPVAQQPKDTE